MTDHGMLESAAVVLIYGVDSCEDTTRAREHLTAAGTAYRYLRMDEDEAARQMVHAAGYFSTPVVVTPSGAIYMEPSDDELDAIVRAGRQGFGLVDGGGDQIGV
jgi:glutaredoxin